MDMARTLKGPHPVLKLVSSDPQTSPPPMYSQSRSLCEKKELSIPIIIIPCFGEKPSLSSFVGLTRYSAPLSFLLASETSPSKTLWTKGIVYVLPSQRDGNEKLLQNVIAL
jgi:hypothetical protein